MVTGISATVAPAASAAPARAAYVIALYEDYLGRLPSDSDITYWSAKLAAGSPRTVISVSFADSDEYRLIRIDNAYRTILGREPEAGGRASWLDGMHRGLLGTDDVERDFYQSDEFYNDNKHDDWTLITALYNRLLGRTQSWEEGVLWLTNRQVLVNQPGIPYPVLTMDRSFVVNSIYNSVEAAHNRVGVMYSTYFHRTPDEGGIVNWAAFDLQFGDAATRTGLTSSEEYYLLAEVRHA